MRWALTFLLGLLSLAAEAKAPDHLVLLVFDQMRPDYVERFDLPNFKRLARMGTVFPEAYIGHLAAETVVSHPVIATGLLPKRMPWQDNFFNDAKGLLGKPGAFYYVAEMSAKEQDSMMGLIPKENFLANRVRRRFGGEVAAFGEKPAAVQFLGTPEADRLVFIEKKGKECAPGGRNIPSYIAKNKRFTIDCHSRFGTEKSLRPLSGVRFIPGPDKGHLGGDIWVADAATQFMRRERWSGLLATFSGIDKMGHMLGDQEGPLPRTWSSPYSFEETVRIADAQLGRILDELERQKLLSRTLIVVTADHGAQTSRHYFGNGEDGATGRVENLESIEPPFWIKRVIGAGKVRLTEQDSMIRVWLEDRSSANRDAVAAALAEVSGVVEIYSLSETGGWHYEKIRSTLQGQPEPFRKWAQAHNQELLDTMACETAPDLVALLADGVGFDLLGEHGGTQEKVQRIPLYIAGPGIAAGARDPRPLRLFEINGVIADLMKLPKETSP